MSERCDAAVGERMGQLARCNRLAWDGAACPWCEKSVFWCRVDWHEVDALQNLEGHKLLAHPERMPEAIALLVGDPGRMELARQLARRSPQQYARLREFLTELGVTL